MRVVVSGDIRESEILLDTKKATGILITNDLGEPNVLFKMLPNGKGWIRFTKGEDKNFDEIARALKLN